MDGLGKMSAGLDHGVFIPFRRMFGFETDIPIVAVSIDSSFDPEAEWKIGQVLDELRYFRVRDSIWWDLLMLFLAKGLREYCCSAVD